jgi:hypothetical protein
MRPCAAFIALYDLPDRDWRAPRLVSMGRGGV